MTTDSEKTALGSRAFDISGRLSEILNLDPSHRAIQFAGRWGNWGELRSRTDELHELLTDAGAGPGSLVGLITRNRPLNVAAIATLLATGRGIAPITSIGSDELVAREVTKLPLAAVIADAEDWKRHGLIDACRDRGIPGISISGHLDGQVTAASDTPHRAEDHSEDRDLAVLMPTSGTTGPPKRIRYTYAHLNGALDRISHYSAATARSLGGPPKVRDSVVIAHLALAHVAGFWGVMQALAEGRSIALLERFEPNAWADLVAEHSAKTASLPPATLRMVLDAEVPPTKLASLISVSCGTAPLDPDTAEEFTAKYGMPVLVAYGATEFPGGAVGWSIQDHREYWNLKRGSVGRARPGIEVRILDPESDQELPTDTEGIVAIRSPQSAAGQDGEWSRTTDIGRIDRDGFIWLVGRSDDAINRGGFKIIPQLVEAVLRRHPAVVDAGVVGVPDRRLGQVPAAAVTARRAVTADDLEKWVREHLASYQVPTEIRILDELPRTASMKVAKADLRRLFDRTTDNTLPTEQATEAKSGQGQDDSS